MQLDWALQLQLLGLLPEQSLLQLPEQLLLILILQLRSQLNGEHWIGCEMQSS